MGRWRVWWKRANLEQFVSFACVGAITIIVFSLVAYSTVYKNPDLPDSSGFDFISLEARCSTARSASGSARCSWPSAPSACSPPRWASSTTSSGSSPTSSTPATRAAAGAGPRARLYFAVVWTMIVFGCPILLLGFDQPLVLLTISTVHGRRDHDRLHAACC